MIVGAPEMMCVKEIDHLNKLLQSTFNQTLNKKKYTLEAEMIL